MNQSCSRVTFLKVKNISVVEIWQNMHRKGYFFNNNAFYLWAHYKTYYIT